MIPADTGINVGSSVTFRSPVAKTVDGDSQRGSTLSTEAMAGSGEYLDGCP